MIRIGMFIEDRYEILEKIGSGGMSDVYKAKCHKLNRFVAIKFLKPEFCEDKNFVSKFQIEAQSAAALLHPNVVSVYDVNEFDGAYYIVMEYVEGITLKQYIDRNGQLPVKEATSIAIQIGQGIEAAHNANIIHRDIKPQNVLISREGKIKVTDFGIARTTTANTISQDILGSVHYISPEQARGGQVDQRSDIYSFGIVYYEMVTGQLPFDGDSTVSIALKHIQDQVPLVSDIVPNIPSSVVKIIEKCTQKKPERRYQKVSTLLSDLKTSLISPNEDFVVLDAEQSNNATILMSDTDARLLRNEDDFENAPSMGRPRYDEIVADEGEDGVEYYEDEYYEDDDYYEEDEAQYYDNKKDRRKSEGDPSKKKMDRILLLCGIVAGIIIIVILAVICAKTLSSGSSGCGGQKETTTAAAEKLDVPEVVGMSKNDAVKAIEKAGFKADSKSEASDKVAKDYVISQTPAKGEKLEKGGTVKIVVSAGTDSVVLDDYTGKTQEEAETDLKAKGFSVKITTKYDDTQETGKVVKTVPGAGEAASKSTVIEIIVSRGAETKYSEVPNVLGKDEATARAELAAAKLECTVLYKEDSANAGKVILQSHTAGQKVAEGTTVNLTVAKEKETEAPTEKPTEKPTEEPTSEDPETPAM